MRKSSLTPNEAAAARLRDLFESRGFRRTTPGKFEDYSLYMDNLSFLDSEHIITFMDMNGRLLALKPDVTLSIVKNIPRGPLPVFEKLYYLDEVYRASKETRDYQVLGQIGVELIGPPDGLTNIEAVSLALDALALLDGDFVLDISHMGFLSGLFDSLGLGHSVREAVLAAVHRKSAHELRDILAREQIPEADAAGVLALAELHGPFHKLIPGLEALCRGEAMREACAELSLLDRVICRNGMKSHVFLDFSVVSGLDYYNGLIFHGYIKGVPKAVLSGGRYDNLPRRMGKESCAIGFGVSLTELGLYRKSGRVDDFDILITYTPDCDYGLLLEEQKRLIAQGYGVRLEPEGGVYAKAGWSYARHCRFTSANVLEEAGSC